MKSACMVVLSGGQDSTTCAVWAKEVYEEVHCVTFDYGQRHKREIEAACNIAKLIKADSHEVVDLGPILAGRSPLTDHNQSLEQYKDFQSMSETIGDRVELTFIPMRNSLFLTLAANRAICKDITTLVTGVCQEDNANYPDCRADFIRSQADTISLALGLKDSWFQIETPLMYRTKAETVRMMHSMGLDKYSMLAFTHTAYDGQYPPIGHDHATILRAQGFLDAHFPDPLILRAVGEGLMLLPDTDNYSHKELNAKIHAEYESHYRTLHPAGFRGF